MNRGCSVRSFVMNQEDSGKRWQEEETAKVFLDWYNNMRGARYQLERTGEVFPELLKDYNWDFVAREKNRNIWMAIEVKKISASKANQEFSWWIKVFEHVTQKVKNKLKGTYLVIGAPNLIGNMNQKQRIELEDVICEALLEAEPVWAGGLVDIWPRIRAKLQHWSLRYLFGETKELKLIKKSNEGSLVRIGMQFSHVGNLTEIERQAIRELLSPKSSGTVKANSQLRIAKQQGAKETIWVIDGYTDQLDDVKEVLNNIDPRLLSDIDTGYLVDMTFNKVMMVWHSG